MATPDRRTLRGPHVVVAFLLLAAAGTIGGWLLLREHPRPTRIVDVRNLNGDNAVLVRDVSGPDDRSFISLYGREHGEIWGALIPRYAGRGRAHSAVAATREVAFVRGTSNGQAAFFAFRSTTGQKLGRIEPYEEAHEPAATGFVLPAAGSLFADGMAFEISGMAGDWTSVLAFGLDDGTLRWQLELGPTTLERVWLRPRHLLLHSTEQVLIIRRDTGALTARIQTSEPVCVTQDTLYTADAGQFLARSLDVPEQVRTLAIDGERLIGSCGTTSAHTLLAVAYSDRVGIVALDRSDVPSWRLAVPDTASDGWPLDEVARYTPDRTPLGGDAIARFVPVLSRSREDGTARMVVIDTDQARIAQQGRAWDALSDAHLMTVDGRHYLYAPGPGILAAIDGDTGEIAAARALDGWNPVWPRHIAGDRIWVTRDDQWAVLDGHTLEPAANAGTLDVGRDARAEVVRELAL